MSATSKTEQRRRSPQRTLLGLFWSSCGQCWCQQFGNDSFPSCYQPGLSHWHSESASGVFWGSVGLVIGYLLMKRVTESRRRTTKFRSQPLSVFVRDLLANNLDTVRFHLVFGKVATMARTGGNECTAFALGQVERHCHASTITPAGTESATTAHALLFFTLRPFIPRTCWKRFVFMLSAGGRSLNEEGAALVRLDCLFGRCSGGARPKTTSKNQTCTNSTFFRTGVLRPTTWNRFRFPLVCHGVLLCRKLSVDAASSVTSKHGQPRVRLLCTRTFFSSQGLSPRTIWIRSVFILVAVRKLG